MLMVALYHGSVGICLAALDHLAAGVAEDLKHPVFAALVGEGTDLHALEGNDALGAGLGSVLEVVETFVVEDKPTSLPALPAAALNKNLLVSMEYSVNFENCLMLSNSWQLH